MMPEQVLQAAKDLNVKKLLPAHSSKFAIGNHAWDEPLKRITALVKSAGVSVITPRIGETVWLKDPWQEFTEWWKNIR